MCIFMYIYIALYVRPDTALNKNITSSLTSCMVYINTNLPPVVDGVMAADRKANPEFPCGGCAGR